jgi:hypothetical protein
MPLLGIPICETTLFSQSQFKDMIQAQQQIA